MKRKPLTKQMKQALKALLAVINSDAGVFDPALIREAEQLVRLA